jgi:hypothetical protein
MGISATVHIRRTLALAALALLTVCAIYGFVHERLFDQQIWLPVGWARFLGYAAVFWVAAGILIALRPNWLPAAAALAVLGYSTWWCGVVFQPVAPFAVLYFLASSFLLGKILARRTDGLTALLAGLAVWILTISIAAHFPVNTRMTYAAAFAVPFLFERRRLAEYARDFRLDLNSRAEAAGLAVLLFVLLAHWLVALKPEVSSDGLSMHLAVPMTVAYQARWPFDFRLYSWAVMPMGGDWAYTGAYLLGGEAAARLLNFAMLVAIAAMIRRASLRWLSPAAASLAAALFVSTPMVQLITGSLFVENVWAAMVVAAVLELWRYVESGEAGGLALMGLLFGSALSAKMGAAVFVALPAAIGILAAARRKHMRQAGWAALLFFAFAAPPYVDAWRKTGNPIFPFANSVFRSPYFETASSVDDVRYHAPLNWKTPYDLAFHSQRYYESQNGALGFQYFLLLLPAALMMTRRSALLPMAVGAASVLLLLVILPNLRYMYPALALFSIPIGCMATQFRGGQFAVVALTGLNLWFMPASGWFHKDFALFRRSQADKYLESSAPQRKLIEDLNRRSPAEPVAFFGGDPIAGLHAPAYSDTWHSALYWKRLRDCYSPEGITALFQELGIHHVIAPLARDADSPVMQDFLQRWIAPTGITSGTFGLFDVVPATIPKSRDNVPAPPGEYDDLDLRIEYTGTWLHDRQFPQTSRGSITYSNVPGDAVRFLFNGTGITYIYTRAFNRGIARVAIDGRGRAFINLYSHEIQWQARSVFSGLDEGTHTIEIRVTQEKSQDSSDHYVDLDGFIVK